MGSLHYFLGIEAYRDTSGLYLTQAKYITDLLKKTKMDEACPLPTPKDYSKILSKTEGDPLDNVFLYRSTIEALQYFTITHPNISYIVSKLSQFP